MGKAVMKMQAHVAAYLRNKSQFKPDLYEMRGKNGTLVYIEKHNLLKYQGRGWAFVRKLVRGETGWRAESA